MNLVCFVKYLGVEDNVIMYRSHVLILAANDIEDEI